MSPAAKTNGHTPELELDRGFIVGSGIECSAPLIAGGHRQDELLKTGHWTKVGQDVALVAEFGIRYLRYGIPFHVVDANAGNFDWAWTDRALASLREATCSSTNDCTSSESRTTTSVICHLTQ